MSLFSTLPASVVPQDALSTRAGAVDLPIRYREGRVMSAVFRVRPTRVAALLGDLPLEPVRIAGKTTVALTLFEYADTSIGPYKELALTSYVRPIDDRRLRAASFWVHALPVTTEGARAVGVDIWGYPKWVTAIECGFDGDTIRGALPGELELQLPRAATLPLPVWSRFTTLTAHNGHLVRTRLSQRSLMRLVRGSRTVLRLTGPGGVADLVSRLGCLEAGPSFGFWCERFESILPAGAAIGAAHRVSRVDGA